MKAIGKRVSVGVLVAFFSAATLLSPTGCSDDNGDSGKSTVAPDPKPCEVNGTANAVFKNESQHSTYDVILDDVTIGSISPKQSISTIVSAGRHRVEFRFSNSTTRACTTANTDFPQCTSKTVWCTGDK